MNSKYCCNCRSFINSRDFCKEFKIKITSIGDASICSKYVCNKITKDGNEGSIKRNLKKCRDCKNLLFEGYCKIEKINITNINKIIICEKFINKNS